MQIQQGQVQVIKAEAEAR